MSSKRRPRSKFYYLAILPALLLMGALAATLFANNWEATAAQFGSGMEIPLPVPTGVASFTPTSTPTSVPTSTPGAHCSVCNAYIADLNISCNPDNTVHWTAVVRNNDSCTVTTPLRAELQIQRNYGTWRTVLTQTLTGSFSPGLTTIQGDFSPYTYPSNTTGVRVNLAFDSSQRGCNSTLKSPAESPCGVINPVGVKP